MQLMKNFKKYLVITIAAVVRGRHQLVYRSQ